MRAAAMRALAALGIVVSGAACTRDRAPLPDAWVPAVIPSSTPATRTASTTVTAAATSTTPPRFDHRAHFALAAWDVTTACASCHNSAQPDQEPPTGALVHTRCNTAGCHAQDFDTLRSAVCLTCHLEKTRVPDKAKRMVAFPQSATFYAELSHKAHLTGKAATHLKDRCADCHASKEKRPTHAQCDAPECHAREDHDDKHPDRSFPMTECAKCHRDLFDAAGHVVWTGPRRRLDRCRVTAVFSHAQHEARNAKCGDCHLSVPTATKLGELVATNGGRTMEKACGKCHDGKRSFSVRGSCESCHTHACVVEGS